MPALVLLILLVMTVLLTGIGVAIYALSFSPRAKLTRRIQLVAGPASSRKDKAAVGGSRRKVLQGKLKALEDSRARKRGWRLRAELSQTGMNVSVRGYVLGSLASAVLCALLVLLGHMPPVMVLTSAVIGGLGLPRLWLRIIIKRRLKAFTAHFADSIDVIVRGIRSGLPVGECFVMIASEAPEPIRTEFRLIVEGQKLGLTIDEVMARAAERVPTAELRFFGIVLAIQQTTGGNLAETLAKLSDVLRSRKRMRDKVQAMSSEAKASAGIIGSLPILVAAILGVVAPHYIGILFTTAIGNLILFIGGCIMGTGILVMRQMINFEL
ncbi:MAG TPA: type II secretion system F family protein [Candidatus Sulfotelmatobacter sp.]|jgi:tight adherence protein B|nr:type II secretion system F family protein [Candidatus Sulfotelmatobacter sp.]